MKLYALREGSFKKSIVQASNPFTSNYAVISLPYFHRNRFFLKIISEAILEN